MVFACFDGDGRTVVSATTITPHTSKPEKLRALDIEDAIRMTAWSWPEEHVYIQTDAKNEEEQQVYRDQMRMALDKKVMADLDRNFWRSVFTS